MIKETNTANAKDWEKEFDDNFVLEATDGTIDSMNSEDTSPSEVKQFISELLEKQREEMIEIVEGFELDEKEYFGCSRREFATKMNEDPVVNFAQIHVFDNTGAMIEDIMNKLKNS